MHQTINKRILPLSAVNLEQELIKSEKTITKLADEYHVNENHLEKNQEPLKEKKVFGVSDFEKEFIIKIYLMTNSTANEIYESLNKYFPGISIGSIQECITLAIKRRAKNKKSPL